jgi:hypothetical protein
MQIAVEQLESKFLRDFIGGIWTTQDLSKIAMHRAAVALQQLPTGGMDPRTVMCPANEGPQS